MNETPAESNGRYASVMRGLDRTSGPRIAVGLLVFVVTLGVVGGAGIYASVAIFDNPPIALGTMIGLTAIVLGLIAAWKVDSFAFPGPPSTLVEIRQDGVCVADWTGGHLRTQDWSNAWTGIEATYRTVVLHH